jgi:peptide chain release factor 1
MVPPSLEAKRKRHDELALQLQDPEVLANTTKMLAAQREMGGLAKIAKVVTTYNDLDENIVAAREMVEEETDDDAKAYAQSELDELLEAQISVQAELEDMVAAGDAITIGSLIMEIRAGAGGDEAAIFAGDLYDMYKRYVDMQGWKLEILDANTSDMGGFKEITLSISGEGAFLRLQFESGGHRVQRVPETETQGRIHTSAATVAVMPEATEVEIIIKPDDLQIETMRAGGPGGQKVNKIESAVRITHLPSGVVVKCQDEKSQHKNRAKAMRVLRSRVLEAKQREVDEERASQRRSLIGSGDRSERIRTYNFPQNRITDHRINLTIHKLDQAMQGQIDPLVEALLDRDRLDRLGYDPE